MGTAYALFSFSLRTLASCYAAFGGLLSKASYWQSGNSRIQQDSLESRLLEMVVGGKRVTYVFLLHDYKRNTVRQRPILVWTVGIQPVAPIEKLGRRAKYTDIRVCPQPRQQIDKQLAGAG